MGSRVLIERLAFITLVEPLVQASELSAPIDLFGFAQVVSQLGWLEVNANLIDLDLAIEVDGKEVCGSERFGLLRDLEGRLALSCLGTRDPFIYYSATAVSSV